MPHLITTPLAPAAIGPYSQAAAVGDLIFTSGQIALDLQGKMVEADVSVQATQVLTNLRNILESQGSGLDRVVKTTMFLVDMGHFGEVNRIYESFFGTHKPARTTICVKALPREALVEIECIALK